MGDGCAFTEGDFGGRPRRRAIGLSPAISVEAAESSPPPIALRIACEAANHPAAKPLPYSLPGITDLLIIDLPMTGMKQRLVREVPDVAGRGTKSMLCFVLPAVAGQFARGPTPACMESHPTRFAQSAAR